MENQAATENAVVSAVTANPVIVLTDTKAYSEFYKKMEEEVSSFEPDLTTRAGREKIAALAYKVTRTKTAIDAAGKKLNEDARAQINAVDAQRRKIREELEGLAEKARKPLTDWEEAEELRISNIKARIEHIVKCGQGFIGGEPYPYGILIDELEEKVKVDNSFGEFEHEARVAHTNALQSVRDGIAREQKAEAERKELERLRAEKEERDRKDAEAAAAAKAEAERAEAEKREAERVAREQAEAKRREEEAAERAREEERKRAAKEIEEANARAKAAEEAARLEKERIEKEAAQAAAEQAAREADKAHRSSIMKAAKEAIMTFGVDEEASRKIVLAIMAGEVPNVSLKF